MVEHEDERRKRYKDTPCAVIETSDGDTALGNKKESSKGLHDFVEGEK
jgi:hypothetical protein